jgi:hypothetical protein
MSARDDLLIATVDADTGPGLHAFVARMDADGALGWSKPIWLGPGDNEADFQTIALDKAGNLLCGGYGAQPGTGLERWAQSFCPTGDERWINFAAAGQITRTSSNVDGQLKKIVP